MYEAQPDASWMLQWKRSARSSQRIFRSLVQSQPQFLMIFCNTKFHRCSINQRAIANSNCVRQIAWFHSNIRLCNFFGLRSSQVYQLSAELNVKNNGIQLLLSRKKLTSLRTWDRFFVKGWILTRAVIMKSLDWKRNAFALDARSQTI